MNPQALASLITLLPVLIQAAGGVFPALSSIFGGIFGTATPQLTASPTVKLLQEGLNAIQASGKAPFEGVAGQPNSPLTVDGNFGGRTFAAVKAVQAAFGWTITEPLASIEMNLMATLLSKL
jgi:hypothetical protein